MEKDNNEQMMERLRKELLLTRIFCIVSSVLMVFLLILGFSLFYKYQKSKEQAESYAMQVKNSIEKLTASQENELTKVDIVAFNQALTNLNIVLETVDWEMLNNSIGSVDWKMLSDNIAGVDWGGLSDNISAVDWKMLSDSISSVDWAKVSEQLSALDINAINKAVEELDTEELSEALANMNGAVEKLRTIADTLSAFMNKLGF